MTVNRQLGFTLIEVLVSALVLVVGILGVAALQVTALRNLQSSGNYGVAAMMANEMADRMWIANVRTDNNVDAMAAAYVHDGLPDGEPSDCVANVCSTDQMAGFDIYEWQLQLQGYTTEEGIEVPGMLPAGQGSIERVAGTNNFLITLRWDDDRSGSSGTNCPPQSDADLDCYSVTVSY